MTTSLLTKNNTGSYDNIVDGVFDGFANRIRKEDLGFDRTAKAIAGIDKNDIVGTAKQLQKTYVQDRLLGVKSSFYRKRRQEYHAGKPFCMADFSLQRIHPADISPFVQLDDRNRQPFTGYHIAYPMGRHTPHLRFSIFRIG